MVDAAWIPISIEGKQVSLFFAESSEKCIGFAAETTDKYENKNLGEIKGTTCVEEDFTGCDPENLEAKSV